MKDASASLGEAQGGAFPAERRAAADGSFHDFHPSFVAHRAVEAVTRVVDLQASARTKAAPSVEIRLTLGGEDLAIKVGMRNGVVQAQFRTASPELCTAIAQQWSAVRAESPERHRQFLEPEFVTTGRDLDQGKPGGFSQQGDSSSRHAAPGESEVFGGIRRSYRPTPDATIPVLEEPLSAPAASSNRFSAVA